jgi:hypothetical protein
VYVLETMSKPYATRVSSPRQRETGSTIQSCRRRRRTRRPTTRRYSDHRLRAGGWFVGSTIIPIPNHSRAEPIHHHLPCSVSVAAAVRLGWSSVARGLGSVSRHRHLPCSVSVAAPVRLGWSSVARGLGSISRHRHLPCSVSVAAPVRLGWSSVAQGLGSVSRHRQAGACAIKAAEFSHIMLRAAGGFLPACLPCRDGGKGCGLSSRTSRVLPWALGPRDRVCAMSGRARSANQLSPGPAFPSLSVCAKADPRPQISMRAPNVLAQPTPREAESETGDASSSRKNPFFLLPRPRRSRKRAQLARHRLSCLRGRDGFRPWRALRCSVRVLVSRSFFFKLINPQLFEAKAALLFSRGRGRCRAEHFCCYKQGAW